MKHAAMIVLASGLLASCADISTGAYQTGEAGQEGSSSGIRDEGGIYQPGLFDGGLDDRRGPPAGGDSRIDDGFL
ncbi:hypothetical protein [Azospirillum sp. SYSU D00513]|uniref:hypothetical protein n=1 Tax=Azospirillum sp. SYSU D00513 TaxID=2812561 RepID=UPI001A96FAA2|nr:hypothetical protein [Azospirillum sp. SYSU D00513]